MDKIEAARRFFEPSKGERRRIERQNEHVTWRPLRFILGLRSPILVPRYCLASSQIPHVTFLSSLTKTMAIIQL